MASEGPTTVGSINATLKLNADEFERKMREAGELADRLDGREINVRTRADVAQAITEMEALDAAEQRVQATDRESIQTSAAATQATRSRADAATRHANAARNEEESLARVEIAERRLQAAQLDLNQVQEDGHATQQRLLRAQNAVEAAGMQYDRALEARQHAVRDATEAEQAATAAEDAATAATDRHTESVNRNAEAQKGQFSWMQVLLATAPYLFASTTELAAAAVGLGTSFTLMGLAGAAGIAGIKKAMKDGTAEGEAYASGLTILKSDLSALEQTGATAMVSSFSEAVGQVNDKMPFLNRMTGEMAGELGKLGGGLINDLLTGLERMSPLIEQERNTKRSGYEMEQNKLLTDLIPEMKDPTKGTELREKVIKMLTEDRGLGVDQLSRWMSDDTGHEILSNAAWQKLMVDGLRYQEIQKAKATIVAKPLPPAQRSGSQPAANTGNAAKIQALQKQLDNATGMQAIRLAAEITRLSRSR